MHGPRARTSARSRTRDRGRDHRAEHDRPLERQPRLGQRAPDPRQQQQRVEQAGRARGAAGWSRPAPRTLFVARRDAELALVVRTATAHEVGPCTSTPFCSAMPPRRIFSCCWHAPEYPARPAPVTIGTRVSTRHIPTRLAWGGGRATDRGRRCRRPTRRVAQELHAELEVVDGNPLVGRVDQPRGELGAHRPQREEAVGDRAERLAQPVRVGEPGDADRRQPRARLDLGDERLDRRPERRAELRARAALAVAPLELVVALAEPRPQRPRSASASVCPGRSRQSTVTSQRPGMTFRFCDAAIIVGATVIPSSGSTISAATGSIARAAASASLGRRHRVGRRASRNPSVSGISTGSGANAPSRSISRAALTSALSAIPGIEPWPLRPWTRRTNGELRFSADEQR